ncbi:Eukaryotic/viral aspartic protease, partial [Phytophthora megakarya]
GIHPSQESIANTRSGTRRSSSTHQTAADDTSSDECNPFFQELVWQIHDLTAMEEMDSTPRFELVHHRPLGKITPFRGKLNESDNSIQWLRGFVYEMKGTHTPPNQWYMAFQLSLRDGAVHWHRALSRKPKRTWCLLSDKIIAAATTARS